MRSSGPPATFRLRFVMWTVLITVLLVAWAGWLLLARGLTPSDDARLAGVLFPSSEWRDGPVLHTVLGSTRGRSPQG